MSNYSLDTPLGRVEITKFNGTNYQRWARQVRNALIAIDAWELIEGDPVVPDEGSSENERLRIRRLNNRGFALIYNSVDEERQIYLDYTGDETCHTAWNLLRILYSNVEILERNFERDSEEVIETWRQGRRMTNKLVKEELVDKLVDLAATAKLLSDGGTAFRIAGSAMRVAGSVCEVFWPAARSIAAPLKVWGAGVDFVGVLGFDAVKVYELGFCELKLNRLGKALKDENTNTNKMIAKLIQMDGRLLNDQDLIYDLPNFFRKRYGKERIIRGAPNRATNDGVPLWKGLGHFMGVPLVEWKGDNALRSLGVDEALQPAFLHGAKLAWNVYYMMSTRGLQSEAQYVTYAKAMLKNLEEELESSLPRDKND